MRPPENDAAPRAGGAGVNGPKSHANRAQLTRLAPPEGVPDWAWDRIARADGTRWAIAERDASGEVVGTAYRDAEGGKTFAPGGRRGLIVPWPLPTYAGSGATDPVYVAEGASDTAALLGLGLDAVGVPMAGHCAPMLAELLADRHVVVVADADEAGRRGAVKIGEVLVGRCASVRIVEPPEHAKDVRAAVLAGANCAAFKTVVDATARIGADPIPNGPAAPAISEFVPFPLQALPAVLRRFAATTARQMACDPVFIVQPAMAALAGAIGRAAAVVVRRGWSEPCALWTAVVAPPSSIKTPARRAAMVPVYRAQREADRAYADAMAKYELAALNRGAAVDTARKAAREGTPVASLPAKPEKPPRPQWIVRDATREALVHVLAVNPRGVLSDQDELAGMLGAFGAYSKARANAAEPDAAFYKSAWSGETFIENRKGDGGSYVRLDPLLSIYGSIQPDALRPVLGRQRIADGSASRFLWALPPDSPALFPVELAGEDDADADAYAAIHRQLCAIAMPRDAEGSLGTHHIGLKMDAQRIGQDWVNANAQRIVAESDPALRAALGKLKGYLFRFALLFHLIDFAANENATEPGPIDAETMRSATAVADWFAGEAERVYGLLAESPEQREDAELVAWVERKGGVVTVRDLTHGLRRFRNRASEANAALQRLVEARLGRWEWPAPGPKGGPPSRWFRLSRAVTVTTTPPQQGVAAGNGDGDAENAPLAASDEAECGPDAPDGGTGLPDDSDPERPDDSAVGGRSLSSAGPCRTCGRDRWWRFPGQQDWNCGACHPPVMSTVEWCTDRRATR